MSFPIDVALRIESHLNSIEKMFKPGVKITLLVRTPGLPDRDLVMSVDNLEEVKAMIARRMLGEGGGV